MEVKRGKKGKRQPEWSCGGEMHQVHEKMDALRI